MKSPRNGRGLMNYGLTRMSPTITRPYWLRQKGRRDEAIRQLTVTIANNPSYLDAAHLLMEIYAEQLDANLLRRATGEMLARFPDDTEAQTWLARQALKMRPDYWEAWNNIAAAYNAESNWDEGIRAGRQAVRLWPDNQLAQQSRLGRSAETEVAAGKRQAVLIGHRSRAAPPWNN